jgi:hypothetical protein
MDDSSGGRCGEIASDIMIILVTVAQLIFFVSFHRYIAWPVTGADGSVTRVSLLTDAYSTWLPFPIAASIIVVVATLIMIFYDRDWFRQIGWIAFCLCGITVTTSLLVIWPFDFGVIPDQKAAEILPTALRVLLIFMAVFYGISALVLFLQFRKRRNQERKHESNSVH